MTAINNQGTTVIVPVILCGGSGTRLWPLSRESYPKQFLKLAGEHSLFQQTIIRLASLAQNKLKVEKPIIVTNEAHRFLVLDQLHQIGHSAEIILEPVAKNTAPSLTLAALHVKALYANAVMIVLPADHAINDDEGFCKILSNAVEAVANSHIAIATLGVKPTYAETGYGYIECHVDQNNINLAIDYKVVINFFEKPDTLLAQHYFQQDSYYWNSGIFILGSDMWLQAIEKFADNICIAVYKAWNNKTFDNPFIRPNATDFNNVTSDSIDYAVIERCIDSEYELGMFELTIAWSDLGTWQAVREYHKVQYADVNDNVAIGDVFLSSSNNCYVNGSKRLVSLLGVKDLIVIDTDDVLLIAHQSENENIKKIVKKLGENKRSEIISHRKVYRPWGWYDSIDESERFKVKRICVNPKASLSLQKHHHRAEHWVVVKGTAKVTCGDKTRLFSENQSTYIPLGMVHRLSNPGNIPLDLLQKS